MHLFPLGDWVVDDSGEQPGEKLSVEDVVDGLARIMGERRFETYIRKKLEEGGET